MIKLNEGLESAGEGVYCTDYVGDIVNWILHKPKPYRIVVDAEHGIYAIADAYDSDHDKMKERMLCSGWIPVDSIGYNENDTYDIFNTFTPDEADVEDNVEEIIDLGWVRQWWGNSMFVPNDDNYKDHGTSYYQTSIPIESGTLLFRHPVEFYGDGGQHFCPFEELRNKLIAVDALPKEYRTVGGYFANSENY